LPSGGITTIATAADGLDWASSLAFGKNTDLWVVNFAIGPPGEPDRRSSCSTRE
jgi:hypothetical protein